jgi:hypothetical protein
LSDDDLAERVQKAVGNTVSRSVSYLAAPAFAAAMLEHQVLGTIRVGQGRLVATARRRAGRPGHQGGLSRVLAHCTFAVAAAGADGLLRGETGSPESTLPALRSGQIFRLVLLSHL